jgi:hypothetical protein
MNRRSFFATLAGAAAAAKALAGIKPEPKALAPIAPVIPLPMRETVGDVQWILSDWREDLSLYDLHRMLHQRQILKVLIGPHTKPFPDLDAGCWLSTRQLSFLYGGMPRRLFEHISDAHWIWNCNEARSTNNGWIFVAVWERYKTTFL